MSNNDHAGTLVAHLRADNESLIPHLKPHFNLRSGPAVIEDTPPIPREEPDSRFSYPEIFEHGWSSIAHIIDAMYNVERLSGVLVWNSVQPGPRAMCRVAQARGRPAFEIDHGCLATYLHGHFEADFAADHVFCSPEHKRFLDAYGYQGTAHVTGRPIYDGWEPMSQTEARARLGISIDGPMVLHTTTWTHAMSAWSDPEYQARAEVKIVEAMQIVQAVAPCAFMTSLRPMSPMSPETLGKNLEGCGLQDVLVCKEEPYYLQLCAADLVVAPKSSAAAEAVIADRPAMILDFRPQLDSYLWEDKGILPAREPEAKVIAEQIIACMKDEGLRRRMAEQRVAGRAWFNGPGDAARAITQKMVEICYS